MRNVKTPMISAYRIARSFVGRTAELAVLRGRYTEMLRGRGGLVLIIGSPGIGKSRLIEEFRRAVESDNPWFAVGNCVDYLRSPYMPLVEILQKFYHRSSLKRVAGATDEKTMPWPWLSTDQGQTAESVAKLDFDPSAKAKRFQNVLDAFRWLSRVRPIVAVLEDLHWADVGTCELLQYLASRLADLRVLFLASYRPESIPSDVLLPNIIELERNAVERVHVQPFSDFEMRLFIHGNMPERTALSFESIRHVEELAEGNPYWAGELLRSVFENPDTEPQIIRTLPRSLSSSILERVHRLGDDEALILEHAAVVGRRFEADLLARTVERPLSVVLSALRRGRDLNLLIELDTRPPSFAFRHALTREVIYNELLAVQTLELHAKIAVELERLAPSHQGDGNVELAYHWSAANIAGKAVHYNEAAAREAASIYAFGDAARFYERALNFVTEPGAHRAHLCEKLAYALYVSGRGAEARPWFELAIQHYSTLGDHEKVSQILLHLARQRWLFGSTLESLRFARRASDVVRQKNSVERYFAEVSIARYLVMLSRSDEALRHLEIARRLRCDCGPGYSAAFYDVRAIVSANFGRVREAITDFKTATRLAELSRDPEASILAWNNYGYLASWLGREAVATRCYERALAISSDRGHTMRMAFIGLGYARTLLRFGRLKKAREKIASVLALSMDLPIIKMLLAEVAIPLGLMLEDSLLVLTCADEKVLDAALASRECERLGPLLNAFVDLAESRGDHLRAKALVGLGTNSLTTADQSWCFLARTPHYVDEAQALAARYLLHESAKLRHTAARACTWLFDARMAQKHGQNARMKELALRAAQTFKRLGWQVYHAQALELAGDVASAAKIYQSIGDIRDAKRLRQHKRRHRQEGAMLTDREMQIAKLVSDGMTSREIAYALQISEHTVIHHLEAAYERLGIHSRSQLVAIVAKLQA
jgi:DNA-binding CsgD family transcriptional regulator/tetratricopeptide (TPR) repeat protein